MLNKRIVSMPNHPASQQPALVFGKALETRKISAYSVSFGIDRLDSYKAPEVRKMFLKNIFRTSGAIPKQFFCLFV